MKRVNISLPDNVTANIKFIKENGGKLNVSKVCAEALRAACLKELKRMAIKIIEDM